MMAASAALTPFLLAALSGVLWLFVARYLRNNLLAH
jgi:hypothetical protein